MHYWDESWTVLIAVSLAPLSLGLFGYIRAFLHFKSWNMSPLRLFCGLVGHLWEVKGWMGLSPGSHPEESWPHPPVPPEQNAEDGFFYMSSSSRASFWQKTITAPLGCAGCSPVLSSQVSRGAGSFLGVPAATQWHREDFLIYFWGEEFSADLLSVRTLCVALCILSPWGRGTLRKLPLLDNKFLKGNKCLVLVFCMVKKIISLLWCDSVCVCLCVLVL